MFCIYGNLAILSNLALLYESTYWSFTSLRMIHFYLKFSKAPHRGAPHPRSVALLRRHLCFPPCEFFLEKPLTSITSNV